MLPLPDRRRIAAPASILHVHNQSPYHHIIPRSPSRRLGKRRRRQKWNDYRTPYEKLQSLTQAEQHLKQSLSFAQLDRLAHQLSDTECAAKTFAAKVKLLRRRKMESLVPPRFQ